MRYTETVEICDVCGKRFYGMPINNHGSYDYINHTNFSNNIRAMLCRTEEVKPEKRAETIVKEFFKSGNERISKSDAIEFLECFKHYKYHDKELLTEVFNKIQSKIDKMK